MSRAINYQKMDVAITGLVLWAYLTLTAIAFGLNRLHVHLKLNAIRELESSVLKKRS